MRRLQDLGCLCIYILLPGICHAEAFGMQWSINKSITDRPKPIIMVKILPMKFSNFAPTFLLCFAYYSKIILKKIDTL